MRRFYATDGRQEGKGKKTEQVAKSIKNVNTVCEEINERGLANDTFDVVCDNRAQVF